MKQGGQNPLVHVEAFSIAGAGGFGQRELKAPAQALRQRPGGPVRPVQIDVQLHPAQGGQEVIHAGVDVLRDKLLLRLSLRLGQQEGEGADGAVVEGGAEVEGAGPPGLEGLPDVGNIHAPARCRLLHKGFQHVGSLLFPFSGIVPRRRRGSQSRAQQRKKEGLLQPGRRCGTM